MEKFDFTNLSLKSNKSFAERSEEERPRQEIYEASRRLAEYIATEKVPNIFFLDNSARQAYIGLKEIWQKEYGEQEEPSIYFINPRPIKMDDDFEYLSEEFAKKYKQVKKNEPLLIYDVCIHTGNTALQVKEFFAKMGFSDVRLAIASPSPDCPLEIQEQLDLICLDERAQLGCHPFGKASYIDSSGSLLSRPNNKPDNRNKGKSEHQAIKNIFK